MALLQKDGTVIRTNPKDVVEVLSRESDIHASIEAAKKDINHIISGKKLIRNSDFIDLIKPMEVVEREAIESALILCKGNAKLAAEKLQISYGTIRNKMSAYKRLDTIEAKAKAIAKAASLGM